MLIFGKYKFVYYRIILINKNVIQFFGERKNENIMEQTEKIGRNHSSSFNFAF